MIQKIINIFKNKKIENNVMDFDECKINLLAIRKIIEFSKKQEFTIEEIILLLKNKCGLSREDLIKYNHISMSSKCVIVLSKNKRIIKDDRVFFNDSNIVVTHIDIVIFMLHISHDWKLLDFNIIKKDKQNESI